MMAVTRHATNHNPKKAVGGVMPKTLTKKAVRFRESVLTGSSVDVERIVVRYLAGDSHAKGT